MNATLPMPTPASAIKTPRDRVSAAAVSCTRLTDHVAQKAIAFAEELLRASLDGQLFEDIVGERTLG